MKILGVISKMEIKKGKNGRIYANVTVSTKQGNYVVRYDDKAEIYGLLDKFVVAEGFELTC